MCPWLEADMLTAPWSGARASVELVAVNQPSHQDSASRKGVTTVSVVVVNWNGGDLVLECLRSVTGQSRPPDEILVVDNASADGSPDRIAAEFPSVRLIRNEKNLGFGGGVNLGARQAAGEWIALLNSDAIADARWVEEMLRAASGREHCGMVACKIYLDRAFRVLDKVGHRIALDGQNFGRGHGGADDGRFDALTEVAWPDGCASLWRREVFERVGGVDEEFFAYADDADLGIRFRLAGYRCALAPAAVVEHRHSQSLGAYSPEKLFLVERNRIWLAMKYFPWTLVVANPFLWAWRAWLTMRGSRDRSGPWARVPSQDRSAATQAILRAQVAGWLGLASQMRKRRELGRLCGADWRARVREILSGDRVSLADLARGDVD